MNPWFILAAVGTVLIFTGTGYFKGRSDANARCDIRVAEMVKAAQEAKDAEAAIAAEAAQDLENEDAEAEVVYRTITREVEKIVDRPVFLSRCIDDDGLRLAQQALAGPGAAAGEPRSIVPEP